jgi:hypothetical protein
LALAAIARSKGRSGCWWFFIAHTDLALLRYSLLGLWHRCRNHQQLITKLTDLTAVTSTMASPFLSPGLLMDDQLKLLAELKKMLDASLITQEEYDIKKVEILKRM